MKKILIILILISINLYSLTKNEEDFLEASKTGNIEKVKELLALGVDVNIQDEDGNTALMVALIESSEVVEELINKGADVNIQNKEGKTALDYAKKKGHNDIIIELLSK